jgi:hypothetical protein
MKPHVSHRTLLPMGMSVAFRQLMHCPQHNSARSSSAYPAVPLSLSNSSFPPAQRLPRARLDKVAVQDKSRPRSGLRQNAPRSPQHSQIRRRIYRRSTDLRAQRTIADLMVTAAVYAIIFRHLHHLSKRRLAVPSMNGGWRQVSQGCALVRALNFPFRAPGGGELCSVFRANL